MLRYAHLPAPAALPLPGPTLAVLQLRQQVIRAQHNNSSAHMYRVHRTLLRRQERCQLHVVAHSMELAVVPATETGHCTINIRCWLSTYLARQEA